MEAMHKVPRHEASLRGELQEHWVAVRNDRSVLAQGFGEGPEIWG